MLLGWILKLISWIFFSSCSIFATLVGDGYFARDAGAFVFAGTFGLAAAFVSGAF